MLKIVSIVFSSILFIGCKSSSKEVLPFYNDASFTPKFLNKDLAGKIITHHIADFSFIDQDSNIFSSEKIQGKIHIANFFFTGCGNICPGMMRKLSSVQRQYKDDGIYFLSFSVTPWSDSVSRLRDYSRLHQIESKNWKLLTGKTSDIYRIARQSYFAEEALGFNKDSSNFLHTEHVLLVDDKKRIRGIYNGTLQLDMNQLSNDILLLKQEIGHD